MVSDLLIYMIYIYILECFNFLIWNQHMKWGIPKYLWNNPNQILYEFDALKFCKTPKKFETKVALLDISILSLPQLVMISELL